MIVKNRPAFYLWPIVGHQWWTRIIINITRWRPKISSQISSTWEWTYEIYSWRWMMQSLLIISIWLAISSVPMQAVLILSHHWQCQFIMLKPSQWSSKRYTCDWFLSGGELISIHWNNPIWLYLRWDLIRPVALVVPPLFEKLSSFVKFVSHFLSVSILGDGFFFAPWQFLGCMQLLWKCQLGM